MVYTIPRDFDIVDGFPFPSTFHGINGISLIYMCKVTHLFQCLEVNSNFGGKNEVAHFKQCHSPWVTLRRTTKIRQKADKF